MISNQDFPNLRPTNYRATSPATFDYNCVAWAAGDTEHWWQPGKYWLPEEWPADNFSLDALRSVFGALGYADCGLDMSDEVGYEKVALYAAGPLYTHAARQLPGGKWTSKLGKDVDIEHVMPSDLENGVYGRVVEVMKRPYSPASRGVE
jgi:hypothetical protein